MPDLKYVYFSKYLCIYFYCLKTCKKKVWRLLKSKIKVLIYPGILAFDEEIQQCLFSFILKSTVRMIRILKETIFLAYLILFHFSFMFPLKRLHSSLLSISGKPFFLFIWYTPRTPSAVAAVTATDSNGQQDESSYYSYGNDEGFKVHPANTPSSIVEWTQWRWWKNTSHRIVHTSVFSITPKAWNIF